MIKTHKELKREYKEAKQKMGVFQIRNQENNRILIDSSLDIKSKCNRHNPHISPIFRLFSQNPYSPSDQPTYFTILQCYTLYPRVFFFINLPNPDFA